jgi:hypothetical protein
MTLKALLLAFGKQEGIRFGVCRRLAESPVGETHTESPVFQPNGSLPYG